MKQKLFSLLLTLSLFTCGLPAQTAGDKLSLDVLLNNGTTVSCLFEKLPVMTFADGKIRLSAQDAELGNWEFSEVKSWSFNTTNAIGNTKSTAKPQLYFDGKQLRLSGLAEGTLHIYDLQGRVVLKDKVGTEHTSGIDLSTLPKGTYVVVVGSTSVKFAI